MHRKTRRGHGLRNPFFYTKFRMSHTEQTVITVKREVMFFIVPLWHGDKKLSVAIARFIIEIHRTRGRINLGGQVFIKTALGLMSRGDHYKKAKDKPR